MDLKSEKILIAGAGISGIGAAALLGKAGIAAAIYDGNEELDKEAVAAKLPEGMEISFELGEFKEELADKYDMLILSPGISIHKPVAKAFYDRKKPVWGEIELAAHFAKGKIAAITGTNGKTTTTALVGSILREYYKSVFVVGNIGIPFTSVALDTTEDSVIAAEISSFQLETTIDFQPEVSAVLNVTPDHLDRHGTMEVYADTKFSISKKQNKEQVIVLNYDDPITREMAKKATARPVMFSRLEELDEGIVLRGDTFIIKEDGKELPVCTTSEIKLLGSHNHENILAAIGITYYMGVPVEQIRDAVMKFTAVEHRIEYVDTVDGVDYYNDSKGTNPDAAIKGISAMTKPTILLGGGYDKKSTYDEWIDAFHGKVRYLIVMGATAQAIADTAKNHGFHNVIFADTFEEAMNIAKEKARPGDAVLQIRDAVMKFTAVEHRIEYVDTVDGVDYYNDSKGTNPDAAIKGISAMTKPTILLGGGYDKKSTYDEWIDAFHGKVRYLIVMGATAQAIADTAKNHGFHNVIFADTFEEAMNIAKEKARPGDAVLLSPACASWGMFKNYEVRGKVFKEIVRKFKG